jgi:diguanylate cyclase (GGDEF)-like protein/PAS domain S-box-containing protein
MSLRYRIALAIAILGSLLVAAVLWTTLSNSIEGVREQLRASEQAIMDLIADLSREALLTEEFGNLQAYVERASRHPRLDAIVVADARDRVVVATDMGLIGTQLGELQGRDGNLWHLRAVHGRTHPLGRLAVEFSDRPYVEAHENALDLGLLVAAGGLVASAGVGLLLGRVLTGRLKSLAEAAEQLDIETATSARAIEVGGSDEVARVAGAFTRMVDRLRESFAALRTARDRLLLPTAAMAQGFALWDAEDRLVLYNQRLSEFLDLQATDMTGWTFAEVLAMTRDRLLDPEVLAGEPDWYERRLARHREPAGVYLVALNDGRFIEVREGRTSDGGTVGIYTDVTETRRQQLALEASERRLRVMMDSVFDAILTTDGRGRIESLNPSAERVFGWSADDAIGLPVSAIIVPPDEPPLAAQATLERLRRLAVAAPAEMHGRHRGGRAFPIEVATSRIELDGRAVFLFTVRDISERKAIEQQIVHHATHDRLTCLPNRGLLEDRLAAALGTTGNRPGELAVMFLDLDRFKLVNDTLGHLVGDDLLVAVADRLRARVPPPHTIARLGGDEFIFLIHAGGEIARVIDIGRGVLEDLRQPFQIRGRELHLTGSIGVSLYPDHGESAELLFKSADVALYQAKAAGKNRLCVYEPVMSAHGERRALMESRLRRALKRGHLEVHYQPEVDLATGELRCLEALVRWHHPELGSIPPDEFIPIAEETDLICAIGRAVLATVVADLVSWRQQGLTAPRVAINVSARELDHEDFAGSLLEKLDRSGIRPSQLELELTERILARQSARAQRQLAELASAGVGLTLDDFGTGYASLSHLRRAPIGRLKIDRTFVRELTTSPSDAALVRAALAMAAALGIEVVAEGIEEAAQWQLLAEAGCDLGQGFFICSPLAPHDVAGLLGRSAAGRLEPVALAIERAALPLS